MTSSDMAIGIWFTFLAGVVAFAIVKIARLIEQTRHERRQVKQTMAAIPGLAEFVKPIEEKDTANLRLERKEVDRLHRERIGGEYYSQVVEEAMGRHRERVAKRRLAIDAEVVEDESRLTEQASTTP